MLALDRLEGILEGEGTWFGQLMGGPQLVAWLVQLDFWMKKYKVNLI